MMNIWVLSYALSAVRTLIRLGRVPRLIRIFAFRILILLVLSCHGSNDESIARKHHIHRGSYMSAQVLLNLLNELRKRDKM